MAIKNLAGRYVWEKSMFLMNLLNYIVQNGEIGFHLHLSVSIKDDTR